MLKNYWNKGGKQKRNIILFTIILLIVLIVMRDDYQPTLLFARKYLFVFLLTTITLFLGLRKFIKTTNYAFKIGILIALMLFYSAIYFVGWHLKMYDYMKLYTVYNNLNKIELNELPLTQNERIQPLRNVFSMANESVGQTKDVSLPHLVRIDGQNKWTMAIQPTEKYVWQGITDNTEEVFAVSSTSPFPRFSGENRIATTFSIGESLKFSRNTYNAVVQRFNIFQLFTMEPSDTFYMKNDNGQWVQVVSLIKWKGFLFPYPAFGGVMVIDSGAHDIKDYFERILIGKGTYISPKEMKNYKFLVGQNILSEKVSRIQAESLKFIGGFTDPLPWNMKTAVKIPEMPSDENQQPYVTDFNFTDTATNAHSGLYHWFGLEPMGSERSSLTFSVFIPSDGADKLYYFDHASKKQGYAGVTAMPSKVIESRKEFDWSVNRPVEFRPYIKKIAGRKRMFFLGTISSVRKTGGNFDGSATPDLAIIDSEYRDVIWINVKRPSTWEKTIYDQLNEAWRSSEGIGYYFTETQPLIDSTIVKKTPSKTIDKTKDIIENLQKQIDSLKKNVK